MARDRSVRNALVDLKRRQKAEFKKLRADLEELKKCVANQPRHDSGPDEANDLMDDGDVQLAEELKVPFKHINDATTVLDDAEKVKKFESWCRRQSK